MPDIFGDSGTKKKKSKKSGKSKKIKVNGVTIEIGGNGGGQTKKRKTAPQSNFVDDVNASIAGARSLYNQFSQKGSVTQKREQLKRKQKHIDSELSLLTEEKKYQTTYDKLQKVKEEANRTKIQSAPPTRSALAKLQPRMGSTRAEEHCGLGCKIKSILKRK